jgi:MoaA/NifB/PqqE/SkfB family radical SAM enzyme
MISVTDRCNLRCQGCWVTAAEPSREMSVEDLDAIIVQTKRQGSYFFGILGGEPLLHRGLFDVLAKHPDCYFQLFTNGTLLTDEVAARLRRLGNVSPLVSVEGLERVSDVRRGGQDVYARAMAGLDACRRHRLLTGVATSVCASNFEDLVSERFVRAVIAKGVHYLWYYLYRPAGPNPCPELALDADRIVALRRFMVDGRMRYPIILVDAYWDHEGRALCPAAVGISHHIGPGGYLEPCPPIQFAAERAGAGRDLAAQYGDSAFLASFRRMAATQSRGCVLLDRPGELRAFVERQGATDSSGRGTGLAELAAMTPHADHHQPGREIPERDFFYRFAKKHWFFGFGAYG